MGASAGLGCGDGGAGAGAGLGCGDGGAGAGAGLGCDAIAVLGAGAGEGEGDAESAFFTFPISSWDSKGFAMWSAMPESFPLPAS